VSNARRDEYIRKAEEMLRGTRWEGDVAEARDAAPRPAAASAAAGLPVADDPNRLLLRISETLNSILDFDEIAQRALDLAIRYLRAERGVVFFLDERGRFSPIAQANVETQIVEDALEYSGSILKRTAEDQALWSGDAMNDQRFSQFESIAAFNIKSFMCVPLKSRGKIVGTVYVDNRSIENRFTSADLDFLRLFANQAGVALENGRLHGRMKAENQALRTEIKKTRETGRVIVGEDPKIKRILEIADRVADSTATVLVTGESGTGKEMIARTIHQGSGRLGGPFVTLNCAAIPEQLLESELFGYMKGAFTGAQQNKIGKFEAADGGTLFLDEIGDMTFQLQAKILRVLQEGTFEAIGSNKTREVDVRVVAATNRDLAKMVTEGTFREDLYYRLKVIVLELPPLRERRGDVPALAMHFLEKCRTGKTAAREFAADAINLLQNYPWPGNIRELENAIMRVALLVSHPVVRAADVAPLLEGSPSARPAAAVVDAGIVPLEDLEQSAILNALKHFSGSRTEASHALGISIRKLQYKIKEYQQRGIAVP
jgi:transcriptional regulator with GAF, ATPase, and Fis domain